MTKRNPRVAPAKKADTPVSKQSVPPVFNFGKWTRPLNQQFAALYNEYRRHITAVAVYNQRAASLRVAGLSADGEESQKLLAEADSFETKFNETLQASYQLELDLWTLIGRTVVSVPDDWRVDDPNIPPMLDFTAPDTYDKYLRMDKLAHLVAQFIEARDSKN